MGFAQEMKDFGVAFHNMAGTVNNIRTRQAKYHTPGVSELGPAPFGGPERKIDTVTTPGTDPDTTETTPKKTETEIGPGGKSFIQDAYNYYRQKGLSHFAAAGAAGNLMQESGGDPRVFAGVRTGDSGQSYYAGQWNNGGAPEGQPGRLDKIRAFAKARGHPKPTLHDQYDFVLEEAGRGEQGMESPYIDTQWAKAFPAFAAAKSTEEATALFRDNFERPSDPGDIHPRLRYANFAVDDGSYPTIEEPAVVSPTYPDEGGDGGGDESSPTYPDEGDDSAAIQLMEIPEVDLALAPAPLVPYPDVQQDPTIYSAEGGVLPETPPQPAQSAPEMQPQPNPAGTPDRYNPGRGYTQQIQSSFVPRWPAQEGVNRITASRFQPSAPGPTSGQLAFRKQQADYAATVQARKDAAAKAAADAAAAKAAAAAPKKKTTFQRPVMSSDQNFYNQNNAGHRGYWGHAEGGMVNGAIPDKLDFAEGGYVRPGERGYNEAVGAGAGRGGANRDQRFQQLLAEEQRGLGSQAGGTTARDNAARRLSAEEGRPSSTAYSAARDPNLFTKPRVKKGATDKIKTDATTPPKQMKDPRAEEMKDRDVKRPDRVEPDTGIPDPISAERADRDVVRPDIPGPGAIPATGDVVGTQPPHIPATGNVVPTEPPHVPATGNVVPTEPPHTPATGNVNPLPETDAIKQALSQAEAALAAGTDPQQVASALRAAGVPDEMFPISLQNALLHFKKGGPVRQSWHAGAPVPGVELKDPGAIPEDADREGGIPTVQQASARVDEAKQDENKPDMEPTPQLMDSVARALHSGIGFLTETFGLRGDGAIPVAGDASNAQAGARRFAEGEGKSTREELDGVDNKLDPDRQLREGDRQLARLAQMTDWYLNNGKPKEAAASAASLMQYGASRFSQLGTMAQIAYQHYQQSNDPKDLDKTLRILEHAYQLIPDGATMDIKLDQERGVLVGTKTNADGTEEYMDVRPEELPGILQGVQNKSIYWDRVFAIADPAGFRQQQRQEEAARVRQDTREYNAGVDEKKYKRSRKDKLEDTAAQDELTRQRSHEGRIESDELTRQRIRDENAEKQKRLGVDYAKINPLRQAAQEAQDATADDDSPEAAHARDVAVSALYDALPPGIDREKKIQDMGFMPGSWKYIAGGGDNFYRGDEPPPADQYPGAQKDENGVWVTQDGKPIRVSE